MYQKTNKLLIFLITYYILYFNLFILKNIYISNLFTIFSEFQQIDHYYKNLCKYVHIEV